MKFDDTGSGVVGFTLFTAGLTLLLVLEIHNRPPRLTTQGDAMLSPASLFRTIRSVVLPMAPVCIAALALLCTRVPAVGQIQTMYGNYLTTKDKEVDVTFSSGYYTIADGEALAMAFRIYQNPPYVTPDVDEIKFALSRSGSQDGNESVTVELWKGNPIQPTGSSLATLSLNASDYAGLPFASSTPGYQNISWKVGASVQMLPSDWFWLVVRFDDQGAQQSQLLWNKNLAGDTGSVIQRAAGSSSWTGLGIVTLPSLKVRGDATSYAECPHSAVVSVGIFGPPVNDYMFSLHTELLCPPAALQYYCDAQGTIPKGTSSVDACALLVQAINNPFKCYGPQSFVAERSGNVVRIASTDCLSSHGGCSGSYVCGDVAGIIAFAKTAGYRDESVGMGLNLYYDGVASGVPADPALPPGTQVAHEVHGLKDGPPTVYHAQYNAPPGASPAQVAAGLARALRLEGDFWVRPGGDRTVFEVPLGDRVIVTDQLASVETGVLLDPAQGPLGQSFLGTEFLNYVDLRTYDGGGGAGASLRVRIRAGSITGPILGTSDPVELPDGWGSPIPVRFYFPTDVSIPTGTPSVLEVVVSGDPWLIAVGPDSYSRGTAVIQGQPSTSADLWFAEGLLRRSPGYYDVSFRINDSGLSWAMVPFDTPDPFDLFALCPSDVDEDGFVDFGDYLAFLNFFDAMDPRADFDGDGVVDLPDYLTFLGFYSDGC